MTQNKIDLKELFVWRSKSSEEWSGYPRQNHLFSCRYCDSQLVRGENPFDSKYLVYYFEEKCPNCGWGHKEIVSPDEDRYPFGYGTEAWMELRKYDINDSDVLLEEIGSHFKRKFNDIYHLCPRRFEELVEDIFKHLGYKTELTKQTRDDGVDIYLNRDHNDEQSIVEVKRFKLEKKIGIAFIDRLRGVQLRKGIPHAKFVTSSKFTNIAEKAAEPVKVGEVCFTMELIDASRLTSMIDIYNKTLPPLDVVLKKRGYID